MLKTNRARFFGKNFGLSNFEQKGSKWPKRVLHGPWSQLIQDSK